MRHLDSSRCYGYKSMQEGNQKFGDADVFSVLGPGMISLHSQGDYLFQRRGNHCSEKGCRFPNVTWHPPCQRQG